MQVDKLLEHIIVVVLLTKNTIKQLCELLKRYRCSFISQKQITTALSL